MLGSWPLKDQIHCDRLTVPALNQGGGKSSRWMKSPRCKVKIPRRRKRSSALQESSGLTFSKLDVHSTNWRCLEPMRNPFCPLISSLFCTHPSSKVGLVLEGSKLEGKLGREDFPQNSQSCTFLFPTEIAEEEDGVCGIGPDHAARELPAEHYALPLCSSRGLPCAEQAGLLRCNIFPSANVFARNQSDKWSGKKVFCHACEKDHRLNEREWKKSQDLRKLSFNSLVSDWSHH